MTVDDRYSIPMNGTRVCSSVGGKPRNEIRAVRMSTPLVPP